MLFLLQAPRRLFLLLAALWLATTSTVVAQSVKPLPTASELQKNLAIIAASTEGESEEIDRLLETTTRQLVTYLGTYDVTDAAAKDLGLDLTVGPNEDARLKVYTFSYSSGGTRGTIHRPVLQWKNAASKVFAYALHEECFFNEIHKLAMPGRSLYLLLGGEKGDSQCFASQALVVEVKGNYMLLPNSAFGTNSSLLLCNTEMAYEASKQSLRITFADRKLIIDDLNRLTQSGYRRKPGVKHLALQFRNGRFMQQP
ncbi:hypothetical protein MTX78_23985 (plasmid) [Hymenobacter tibetensis]|uniref:Uncharacterized protein n=1 Tax=Hymenobacter tibetensis TaxID=497967 RepID=A0ABY4D4Z0_9BACT|nr:hypothetical protein [Hymenobacter tibetensis]UOG77407.1 hypothetical protein MTX78_23985 [Hymenobacter tibetensis]